MLSQRLIRKWNGMACALPFQTNERNMALILTWKASPTLKRPFNLVWNSQWWVHVWLSCRRILRWSLSWNTVSDATLSPSNCRSFSCFYLLKVCTRGGKKKSICDIYIFHSWMDTFAAVTTLLWILGGPLRADWGLAAKDGNPPSVSKRAVHAL